MMESKMEDRWLSVDEIRDYLGIKRDTVYKWISEKGMPADKIACGKEHFKALGKEVEFAVTNAFEDFSGKSV
jgi:excisionase family DNA binding protein